MRYSKLSLSSFFVMLGVSSQVQAQQPPEITITYHLDVAIPVLGTGMLLFLGIMLSVVGAVWLYKNPGSSLGKLALSALGIGLLTSMISGGWLMENAQAVQATATYLMSDNPSPVRMSTIPAVLENDLESAATVTDIVVTGCFVGNGFTGSCAVGSLLPGGGGSCTVDSICSVQGFGFNACVGVWCQQQGTLGQYTRCESASADGLTCFNPEIRYGSVEGGIPAEHSGNRFDLWCQQLGFSIDTGVAYGSRSTAAPNGRVFGCSAYDESSWHWCDWRDGYWLDQSLDHHLAGSGTEIVSVSCAARLNPEF